MSIEKFITKTVPFRFAGTDMKLNLSQGLFSGFEVDKGSQLLLKSLAQKWTPPDHGRVADLGCGVGTLGLAIKNKWPTLSIEAVDRDALATAFTKINAKLNKLEITCRTELGMENPEGDFDLVVSNLPAKAGTTVLTHFLGQMAARLKPEGRMAVVIVTPLAQWLSDKILELGGTILHEEETHNHKVFHFTLGKQILGVDLDPYLRTQSRVKKSGIFFDLQTVYGLPNFDTLDYELELGLGLLKKWESVSGSTLFWNPGQGHLPLVLGKKLKHHKVILAGRDFLSLRITRSNLSACAPMDIDINPTPCWSELRERGVQQAVILWEKTPQVKEEEIFWETLGTIMAPASRVLIISKSHDIQDLIKTKRGWPIVESPKHKGMRALMVERS